MELWLAWFNAINLLRPAFTRYKTFLWFISCVAGLTIRSEQLGVTSIIRALGLDEKYYTNLLDTFHSPSIILDKLTQLWVDIVVKLFTDPVKVNGRLVLVGDGLKIPKCGKKMPSVKKLHQQSESNTKPEYIMGHSFQAVGLLVKASSGIFSVPLTSRIHEGLVLSNRCRKTLLDKMITLLLSIDLGDNYYFIADAYYANGKTARGLIAEGNHLVTRAKTNAVAFKEPTPKSSKTTPVGRPKKYGNKVKLKSLFNNKKKMLEIASPVYDEKNITIQYRVVDLIWKPLGKKVRFVAVVHPTRGKCLLMTTDTSLDPVEIIRLYGLRFKIELSFKQAVRTLGVYSYHFWMMDMEPVKRNQGNQHLHRKTDYYREQVKRKIQAYHVFVQAGIIAQGLLQYLACAYSKLVWNSFGSWLRTIRPGLPPSEMVTAMALRNTYSQFLLVNRNYSIWTKFLTERLHLDRFQRLGIAV